MWSEANVISLCAIACAIIFPISTAWAIVYLVVWFFFVMVADRKNAGILDEVINKFMSSGN